MDDKIPAPEIQEALRVSQLDAAELDTELFDLFRAQIDNAFKYFRPSFTVKYSAEISAALRLVLWKFSVDAVEATIGQQLLEVRYRDAAARGGSVGMSRAQKLLYAALTVGAPWLLERQDDLTAATQHIPGAERVWGTVGYLVGFWKAASLINFLVFLTRGHYQYLWERLLRIRPIFPQPTGVRQIGFEYMDRELLWHGFAEFLFFVLPLINFRKMKNFALRQFMPTPSSTTSAPQREERDYTECVACGNYPNNPRSIGCKHVFCYYCVQSNYTADPAYSCPICGQKVESAAAILPIILHHTDSGSEAGVSGD